MQKSQSSDLGTLMNPEQDKKIKSPPRHDIENLRVHILKYLKASS